MPVRIPEGCLLLQAGKEMEWLTGGHVKAGMHEVLPLTLNLKITPFHKVLAVSAQQPQKHGWA